MSNPDHNETEEDNQVTKDDNWVTEDDNRDDCLPSSNSLYRNQRDYNADKKSVRTFRSTKSYPNL